MRHADSPGVRVFGHLPDGTAVHAITLAAPDGIRAQCLTYGGILRSLRVPVAGNWVDVVLGLPDMSAYLADRHYLGALVGRYGNRIANARFRLDGRDYQLDRNHGDHHLHGGSQGFARRLWALAEHSATHAVLHYDSPAGEQGYPGALAVRARLAVHEYGLTLHYEAQTDATTVVNLTHHPYFNLSGDPGLRADAQWLRIPAEHYLPVDDALIPLGEMAPVQGSPFDFRSARPLTPLSNPGHEQLRRGGGYDHCLILPPEHAYSAELYSPHSGIIMRMQSPMPGVQLYGGQGLGKAMFGMCLEPQHLPDAPNRAHFPDTRLHPGQAYQHCIDYRFAAVAPGADWDSAVAAFGQ